MDGSEVRPAPEAAAPRLPTIKRPTLFRIFFFAVFLFLLYQFLRILYPFLGSLMGATTLALIFYPLHRRIYNRLRRSPSLAAGLSTVSILFIVIVPVLLFLWIVIRDAAVLYPAAEEWVRALRDIPEEGLSQNLPPALSRAAERLQRFFGAWEIDPEDIFLTNVDQVGKRISAFGARLVRNFLFFAFDLLVLVFALFFFFRDGASMTRWVMDLVPMEQVHKTSILQRLDRTLSAVVRGVFLTAAAQGLLAGIGFALVNVQFPVALGFATAFGAMIPFVGPVVVWVPVAIYLFFKGFLFRAIFLTAWGALVVGLTDNIMRPLLIGERARLPFFLLFFGILGGLQVYGPIGILIGPLMIASVLSFAKIYREEFYQAPKRETMPPPLAG
jgi:predicted PurR-regulated permease PerM